MNIIVTQVYRNYILLLLFILILCNSSIVIAQLEISYPHLALSADGRYLAFDANLYEEFHDDVFRLDRQTGIMEFVSLAHDGTQSNGSSIMLKISNDGQFVLFSSYATNLLETKIESRSRYDLENLYIRDMRKQHTYLVNVDMGGNKLSEATYGFTFVALSGNAMNIAFTAFDKPKDGKEQIYLQEWQSQREIVIPGFIASDLSKDGRYLLFTDFVQGLFRYDSQLKVVDFVNISIDSKSQNGLICQWNKISDNGRFVCFTSDADNLVADDKNGFFDVFVRDMEKMITTRVSVSTNGCEGNGPSGSDIVDMSADGRFIVFDSKATNLVKKDGNKRSDYFLHDTHTRQTTMISLQTNGKQFTTGPNEGNVSISADGKYIVFAKSADLYDEDLGYVDVIADNKLVPFIGPPDLYIYNVQKKRTTRVNISTKKPVNNFNANIFYPPFAHANSQPSSFFEFYLLPKSICLAWLEDKVM